MIKFIRRWENKKRNRKCILCDTEFRPKKGGQFHQYEFLGGYRRSISFCEYCLVTVVKQGKVMVMSHYKR